MLVLGMVFGLDWGLIWLQWSDEFLPLQTKPHELVRPLQGETACASLFFPKVRMYASQRSGPTNEYSSVILEAIEPAWPGFQSSDETEPIEKIVFKNII